jgi:hypothetical protein
MYWCGSDCLGYLERQTSQGVDLVLGRQMFVDWALSVTQGTMDVRDCDVACDPREPAVGGSRTVRSNTVGLLYARSMGFKWWLGDDGAAFLVPEGRTCIRIRDVSDTWLNSAERRGSWGVDTKVFNAFRTICSAEHIRPSSLTADVSPDNTRTGLPKAGDWRCTTCCMLKTAFSNGPLSPEATLRLVRGRNRAEDDGDV